MVSLYIRLVPSWYRVDHERTTCSGHALPNRLAVLDIVIDMLVLLDADRCMWVKGLKTK